MMQNQQQSYQQGSNSPLASNNNYHSQQQKPGYTSKKCNCKQSQCIKLYCECYAAGVYCNGCHCVNCKNNDQSEGWRNQAIQNTLVKNPTAFLPKISQKAEATSKVVDPLNLGKHNKGCACKRSGCMKKYCECFQAGVPCSENCKCTDCQNTGFVSHGNLLRQFREDDSYNSQNQILHKFLLAHNEEHLTSILGEQNGGTEFGIYKKGIPIKSDFIEDSCMKLLQILHLPDEDIFKRRDQILLEKYNKNHTLILKEEHQQESNINQKKEDRILKTPPQKSKRPDGTAGEGEGQKSGENYNKDSYDIDLACQDENMDEEDDHVDHNKQNNYNKGDSKEDKIVKGSAGEHFNKDSEILSMNKDISESNQTESTAVSSINKFKPFSQKTDVKPPQKFAEESQKDGDKIECEEDEQHQNQIKPEEEKKESHEEEKNKEEEHENNGNEGKEGEIEEETEGVHKKQVRLRHNMEHLGNEMDIECHSSALKRKQELYEIRRSFILETFIDLLRHVEQTI